MNSLLAALPVKVLADFGINNPKPTCPTTGFCNLAGSLLGYVEWGAIILGVLAVMVTGVMLFMQQRNPDGPMGNISGFIRVVFGIGIVVAALGIVSTVVTAAQS